MDTRTATLRMLRTIVPKRYVIIHGFYGMGNVGDEAILSASLDEIRRVTDLTPFVFAWNPGRVREEFGVPSLNPNRSRSWPAVLVLLQSRAYMLGGGGLLKDYGGSPASLARWLRWPSLAADLGVRTMLWSVGVDHVVYDDSRQRVRSVLEKVDVVTVRDPASAARLKDLGVSRRVDVTADPVPHYVRRFTDRKRGEVPWAGRPARIGVCPRHWFTLDNEIADEHAFERLLTSIAGALDELGARHGSEICFIPLLTAANDDDREICRAIMERMRYQRCVLFPDERPAVRETLQRIGTVDLLVGMRLHAVIMATTLGIPTLAISYMPKVADYMDSIDQADFCADVADVSAEWLIVRADEATARHSALSEQLLNATARLDERFLQNGRLLADLLEDHSRLATAAE